MLIILFFLAFISSYFLLKSKTKTENPILESILVVSLLLYVFSEILSAFTIISQLSSRLIWAVTDLILIALVLKKSNWRRIAFNLSFPKSAFPYLVIAWLTILYTVTFIIIVYTPPYNWDSMTYHLPRIFQWIQNDSLNHFATVNTRQINLTPFAEYVGMHFFLLSDSDFGFNLVQWLFSISILIAVFKITVLYEPKGIAKWFAVLFASTMPMFILQTTSTQNDLVAAFYLLSAFYFVEKSRKNFSIENSIFLGISIGLAVLSKGTNYIFLLPLAIWAAIWILKKWPKQKPYYQSFIIIGLFILINMGFWLRNYEVYEKPIASEGFFVTNPNSGTFISNTIKNGAQNLFLATTYLNSEQKNALEFNNYLQFKVYKIHDWMNLKVDFPKKSWLNTNWQKFKYRFNLISEDFESNPLQFLCILLLTVPMLASYKLSNWKNIALLIAISGLGFLLFSQLLKWQPWHNRQLVGIIALWGISISIYLSRIRIVVWLLGLLLIAYALNPLFDHGKRSLLKGDRRYIFDMSEKELIYAARMNFLNDFQQIESEINRINPKTIGFQIKFDDWEYPFWYYLWDDKRKFYHINVNNKSAKLQSLSEPDLIFTSYKLKDTFIYNKNNYHISLSNKLGNVYKRN